jgi:hypothetical protein
VIGDVRGGALATQDLLQLGLELGPAKARAAGPEVLHEMGADHRIELSVDVELDLIEDFVATNL